MELIKAIAKDQGFTLEISNPGFDAAVSDVQNGNADGMIAGVTVEMHELGDLLTSHPYYTTN